MTEWLRIFLPVMLVWCFGFATGIAGAVSSWVFLVLMFGSFVPIIAVTIYLMQRHD